MALSLSALSQPLHQIKVPDPIERMKSLAELRQMGQTGQINDINIQNAQQKQAEAAAVHQAIVESGGDFEAALPIIAKTAPGAYPALLKMVEDQKTFTTNREVTAQNASVKNLELSEGMVAPETQIGRPGTITPPSVVPEGGTVAPIQSPIPAGYTQVEQLPEQPLPGIPSLGVAASKRRPQSAQQQFEKMLAETRAKKQIEREANTYTITDPTTGKTITGPKDLIDNVLTQTGANARDNPALGPVSYQEYQIAKKEGFKGSYNDYQDLDANRKKSITNIHIGQNSYAGLDATTKATVDAVAAKVASGQFTVPQGQAALGGVRGGLGGALTEALANNTVLPTAVRTAYSDIQRAKNLMVPVQKLIEDINKATSIKDKTAKSAQLENYVQAIGTQFARAKGERGVVTDEDVKRVLGLIPGWKSANFAPGFAQSNLKLVQETFDRDEKALLTGYFSKIDQNGNVNTGGTTGEGLRKKYNY